MFQSQMRSRSTCDEAAEPVCALRAEYTIDEISIALEEYLCSIHIQLTLIGHLSKEQYFWAVLIS